MPKLSQQETDALSKLNQIIGNNGSKVLGVAAHTALNMFGFVVQEDTTITVFEVSGSDALSDYGLSGVTLKQGGYISVPDGMSITAITITAGSAIGYNR